MKFELRRCGKIIQAAMLLHNFLVNRRLEHDSSFSDDKHFFESFDIHDLDSDSPSVSTELANAQPSDNNEPSIPGRFREHQTAEHFQQGNALRVRIGSQLVEANLGRRLPSLVRLTKSGYYFQARTEDRNTDN